MKSYIINIIYIILVLLPAWFSIECRVSSGDLTSFSAPICIAWTSKSYFPKFTQLLLDVGSGGSVWADFKHKGLILVSIFKV